MTAPPEDTTTDLHAVIAALRAERDAGLAREATLAEALAQRNSEFGERIEYQAATLDVLRAMSVSPGDPQPVFDLIVERARDLCEGYGATVLEFDGRLLLHRASTGIDDNPAIRDALIAAYPKAPERSWPIDLAVLERRLIVVDDYEAEPNLDPALRNLTHKSVVALPLMRGEVAVGALALGGRERGGFSDSQIALLQTFAEQAVIAITSAETYRALQTRTSDLQESLEYQTATSDVLKVISRSTFDLQPVLDTVAETAAKLCDAEQAAIYQREDGLGRLVANCGFPSEYEALVRGLGAFPLDHYPHNVVPRAILEGRTVHIHDVAILPGYGEGAISLGKQRTSLGVPLLREGQAIGSIVLARQRVEPFTDRQIELVSTFADQAVIAIENTRLLTEQQEALEQQTATAEVLEVINASPEDLTPVFDTILAKAHSVCGADVGMLTTYDGENFRALASFGYPDEVAAVLRRPFPPGPRHQWLFDGAAYDHQPNTAAEETDRDYDLARTFFQHTDLRTLMAVALRKDGKLLGFISAHRHGVRPYTDQEIALLENFAAQAVIAMENARLLNEQREALEQQTATAEVLQVINASPGNLTPVFDAILDKAHSLCGATVGSLTIYKEGHFHAVATHGYPEQVASLMLHPNPPNSTTQELIDGVRFCQIEDIRAIWINPDYLVLRALVEYTDLRTVLFVPLRKDGALLGFISVNRPEVRPFSEREIALLENFAAQAVIAMENARLVNEQREALEQQTATAEVLQVINTSLGELGPVFEAMLDRAMRLCEAAFGEFGIFDGERFKPAALLGVPTAYAAVRAGTPRTDAPGTVGRLFREGASIAHIADLMAEEIYRSGNPDRRSLVDLGGARTMLAVALRKDGALLGEIMIYRQEVRPFSDRQIALLQNFAAQAVIAMENARLITEQREALEQQTATAEVLQVINSSPGNLTPVFDAMLERATTLCGASFGILWDFDGEYARAGALHQVPAAYAELCRAPFRPSPGSGPARIMRGEDTFTIADLTEYAPYQAGDALTRALVDLAGARSVIIAPLRKDATTLGAITLYRKEVIPFTGKQIALLQNFAAQAVIAMENARLLTETREALEQQTATAEVLQVINTSPGDLAPVFDAILEKAHTLCGAGVGALFTYDGTYFRAVATRGFPEQHTRVIREPFRPTSHHQPLISGERYLQFPDMKTIVLHQDEEVVRSTAERTDMRTGLGVPLRKDGTLLGYISAFRQEVRLFSEKEISLLENFAAQAVIAMENARLLTEQQEALEQQTATAEVLQVINASPGNLAPVFDAVLEKAMRLCGAAFGSLFAFDGKGFQSVAQRGVPTPYAEFRKNNPPKLWPGSPIARLIETKRTIHVLDFTTEDIYRLGDADARSLTDLGDARTILFVPLLKDDAVLGFISIFRQEVRAFSDKQIALLENFAAHAVIAMESARLLNELRSRTNELVQRQAELRVTFENMGDGVAMFDETQHLIAWNRKFQDILDVPDDIFARRQTFTEYVRYLGERGEYGAEGDPVEHVRRLIEQAGQARTYERTRPDGRVIEIRHNPVPGGGFVLIYADITERKRNEAEIRAARDAADEASRTIEAAYRELKTAQANLIQAEKMASLGQLTAGIAHEIKNPLNFVNNFSALSTELIDELRDVLAPEPLGETARTEVDDLTALLKGNLEKVVQHGQRADGIVRSMLDHSRGSSGERRMVDLNALIDEALNLAYHGARAQDQSFNITLERDFGEGIAPIEVNPQDITRVFLNIFSNGFYAANKRARSGEDSAFVPTLKVTTRDAGEAVEIHVRDNGTGIPADIRDKLFQPFFTTKPTGEGTGLGLSITYDIVTQQHGGSITVDSKVGEYSEFTIRLPRNP